MSVMSSISVPAAYRSKVAKTLVLAPPQSASAFVHQLATKQGAFLSAEDLNNRFRSLGILSKDTIFLTLSEPSSPAFWQAILDALALDASKVVPKTMDNACHSCPINLVALDKAACAEYKTLRTPCLAFLLSESASSLLQSLAFSNENVKGEAAPGDKAKADWLLVQHSATATKPSKMFSASCIPREPLCLT